MAIKFSDFTGEGVVVGTVAPFTELVGYKSGTTTNTRYNMNQVTVGVFASNSGLTTGSILFTGAGGITTQDNANLFWDDSNNRLGLGEASPDSLLHLKATAPNLRLEGSAAAPDDNAANLLFYNGTDNIAAIKVKRGADAADGEIDFFTANDSLNSSALHIDQNNKVGIGVTDPDETLEIAGNEHIQGQAYSEQHDSLAGNATVDWDNGNIQYIQLASGANTFTPSNPKTGATYILQIKQPSGGAAGTVTWGSTVKWPAGAAPTLTTDNNAIDIVTLMYNGTTTHYYASSVLNLS